MNRHQNEMTVKGSLKFAVDAYHIAVIESLFTWSFYLKVIRYTKPQRSWFGLYLQDEVTPLYEKKDIATLKWNIYKLHDKKYNISREY